MKNDKSKTQYIFLGANPSTGINNCTNCWLDFKLLTRSFETVNIAKVPEKKLIMKGSLQQWKSTPYKTTTTNN